MTRRPLAVLTLALAALLATAGCSAGEDPAPAPTSTSTTTAPITAEPTDEPPTKDERIAAAEDAAQQADDAARKSAETAQLLEAIETAASFDLSTDAGLCAADAEVTNLELNDALAPLLGFPADRDFRTAEQTEAVRAHKNAAFLRACPERAS